MLNIQSVVSKINRLLVNNLTANTRAVVMTLHQVNPEKQFNNHPNDEMIITPSFLEQFIIDSLSRGYEFISLDSLHSQLINGSNKSNQIVLSFDDGYQDNYLYAYPLLSKFRIPFAIYITPSFIIGDEIMWWYDVEKLINENDMIFVRDEMISCASPTQKLAAFNLVRKQIVRTIGLDMLKDLNLLFQNYTINWTRSNNGVALKTEQILELAKDPLVTIGGHLHNHVVLNNLTFAEAVYQIDHGNQIISMWTQRPVEHIAFPFGSKFEISNRDCQIANSIGLKTAVTTRRGQIYNDHKNHLTCLPRIMLTENFSLDSLKTMKRKLSTL